MVSPGPLSPLAEGGARPCRWARPVAAGGSNSSLAPAREAQSVPAAACTPPRAAVASRTLLARCPELQSRTGRATWTTCRQAIPRYDRQMVIEAIRTRMRDPGLRATASVDPATVRVMFEYVAWATVWLLVGTTAGLIASIKLHWPEFLPFAWLSFGRVRPVHTNLVLFGWGSLVLVGPSLYV